MAEELEIRPIVFPPEVLARISPEISLQRHLALESRPCSRGFDEFRDIVVTDGNISRYSEECQNKTTNNIIGSNVLRSGKTFLITSITGGIVEETLPVDEQNASEEELIKITTTKAKIQEHATIFPVVEVQRGRVGAPTDEEMVVSQRLHEYLLHSGILEKSSLDVKCGVRRTNESGENVILYPEETESDFMMPLSSKRKWSYVLYAKIQVFSRNGPIFELCWNSLMYALQTVQLPRAFLDERAMDLKIPVKTRGRSMTIRETYDLMCDPMRSTPLVLNKSAITYASNFGIVDIDPLVQVVPDSDEMKDDPPSSVLLADIESEAEETCLHSTLSYVVGETGKFTSARIIGGGSKVTLDFIKKSIALSKSRTADLKSKSKS